MARKTTSGKSSSSSASPANADADAVNPQPQATQDAEAADAAGEQTGSDPAEPVAETGKADPSQAESAPAADLPDPGDDAASAQDTAATETNEDVPAPPPPVTTEQVVIRKGGFVPLLVGGLAAGAIGLGAGYYLGAGGMLPTRTEIETAQTRTSAALKGQSARIDALARRVDAAEALDPGALREDQANLRDALDALAARLDAADGQFAELAARIDRLETRPLAEGASDAAVAAYEAELRKLQQAMAAQRAEIETMTAEARAKEQNAEAMAKATMRRAALSRIRTALDTGGGFAAALADLQAGGAGVPPELADAAREGVATLAELQARFPDAARAALATARDAAAKAGETGGFTAFLRNQLGARSLEPRAGDDPDAILSRAEAAVRDGRLSDALAEIDTLPGIARTDLAGWVARARHRLDTLATVERLSEELN